MKNAINYTLTEHGEKRGSQRGIGTDMVDFLLLFGDVYEQKGGTYLVSFDEDTRKRIRKSLKRLMRCLDKPAAPTAVIGDEGRVITLEHRFKTIRHTQHY